MSKLLLISVFSTLSLSAFSQDTIRQHSGEKLVGKIIASKPYTVDFTYPGETSYTTLPKSLINTIIYASGRKELVSELVDISGEEGWKNVMITNNPEEVLGLTRVGEIRAKANNMFNVSSVSGVDAIANDKLQKEAAVQGAHIILMLQNDTKGVAYKSAAQSFKSGIAYRYPFKNLDNQHAYSGKLARQYYGADKSATNNSDSENPVGKKVLFQFEEEVFEGEIVKAYGNFYKIKFTNKKGKEQSIEKHMDKVEFGTKR